MDEMKLKLSTKFMKNIVTTLISKVLIKKFGYDIDVILNEIELKMEDGKVKIHADVDAQVDNSEFLKIIKSVGLD